MADASLNRLRPCHTLLYFNFIHCHTIVTLRQLHSEDVLTHCSFIISSHDVVFEFFHLLLYDRTWCSSLHTIHAHVNIRCITLSHNFHFSPCLPCPLISLMDYIKLASSIHDLTRSLTNWSSTVCIPTSESGKLLDISSAAKGNSSSIPLGATKQPTKYPTGQNGSFYRFDPALYGPDSWEDLKRMLCKTGCVSECKISTRHTRPATSSKKKSYTLACQQFRTYESRAAITFTPGSVGPNNVIGQKMKRHKALRDKGK